MGMSQADIKVQAAALNEELVKARKAYYSGMPIMSDAQYDTKEAELRGLVAAQPVVAPVATVLTTVGDTANTGGRITHERRMLSIENQYTLADSVNFFKSTPTTELFVIEPKWDGISVELKYDKQGQLFEAVTRGDGEAGEDITAQVLACNQIPSVALPYLRVRGELVMSKTTFNSINAKLRAAGQPEKKSPRNLAAGTMKQQDLKIVTERNIEIRPWDLYISGDATSGLITGASHFDDMKALTKLGFTINGVFRISHDKLTASIEHQVEWLKKQDYEADGVVIKIDNKAHREALGMGSHTTNWQCAFKSQNSTATTYLLDVKWQIGRQGKLTPVGIIEPVVLAGATIERVMLNNTSWLEGMGIKLNAQVEVCRSGEVIPVITKTYPWDGTGTKPSNIKAPYACPECGTKITAFTDPGSRITTHWCESVICPGRLRDSFTHIANREILEIDALGPDMANTLVSGGYATSLADLFEFGNELEVARNTVGDAKVFASMAKKGFSGAAVLKMSSSLQNAKTAKWDRWIAALGIPMISLTLGKVFATQMDLGPDDMGSLHTKLRALLAGKIEGFGDKKRDELKRWLDEPVNIDQIVRLAAAGVRPTALPKAIKPSGAQPLKGINFVITGTFTENREGIAKQLVALGASEKGSVSSKVNLLIMGTAPGGSKVKQATTLNIKMVGYDWIEETFKANGVTPEA